LQHGHRSRLLARATLKRRRRVAYKFEMCRSGRIGGAAGSIIFYGIVRGGRASGHAGPHALTGVSGARNATYCYDENGNMVLGDGGTVTWAPFDKPVQIVKGAGMAGRFSGRVLINVAAERLNDDASGQGKQLHERRCAIGVVSLRSQ